MSPLLCEGAQEGRRNIEDVQLFILTPLQLCSEQKLEGRLLQVLAVVHRPLLCSTFIPACTISPKLQGQFLSLGFNYTLYLYERFSGKGLDVSL